jgi:hypothetical protein
MNLSSPRIVEVMGQVGPQRPEGMMKVVEKISDEEL